MNLIDNGIEKVLEITTVINEKEMYFLVKFIDYYGKTRERKFSDIKNIENKSWSE